MAGSHEDLEVWRLGVDLVDAIYDLCFTMPSAERFGLISQMQRASVSVPANIAEGCGRDSTKDLPRHLAIAQGSLAELRTLLLIVKRRKFVAADELEVVDALASRVGRLLVGFQRALRKKIE